MDITPLINCSVSCRDLTRPYWVALKVTLIVKLYVAYYGPKSNVLAALEDAARCIELSKLRDSMSVDLGIEESEAELSVALDEPTGGRDALSTGCKSAQRTGHHRSSASKPFGGDEESLTAGHAPCSSFIQGSCVYKLFSSLVHRFRCWPNMVPVVGSHVAKIGASRVLVSSLCLIA